MTHFDEIKSMNLEQFAEFITGTEIEVIELVLKKIGFEYKVPEKEKAELFEEVKQSLESEVSSND